VISAIFQQSTFIYGEKIDNDQDIDVIAIVFDSANSRYLISNWYTGNIMKMNIMGQVDYFNTGLFHTSGIHQSGGLVYAASNQGETHGLAVIHPFTGNTIQVYDIPGLLYLKDITSDNSENLYVTDYESDQLFKIAQSNYSGWVFSDSPLLHHPNGILFDEANNRLLVMNEGGPGAEILSVDLADSSVTVLVSTNISLSYGLTMDTSGIVYFSSWESNAIYRYDPAFTNPAELISSGHNGPADIFYIKETNSIAIPNFTGNSIEFIQAGTTFTGPGRSMGNPSFRIKGIYPNPFSEEVMIEYALSQPESVRIRIVSPDGRIIRAFTPVNHYPGDFAFTWDGKTEAGKDLEPGVFLVVLSTSEQSFVRKLIRY
jgi:DNA-binding beta-propeller fold protein YncE